MTVRELIEELSQRNPDLEVWIPRNEASIDRVGYVIDCDQPHRVVLEPKLIEWKSRGGQ
jgi:hypothetical protein